MDPFSTQKKRHREGRERIRLYKVMYKEDHGEATDRHNGSLYDAEANGMALGSVALVFLCYLRVNSNEDLGFSLLAFSLLELILVFATGIFNFWKWGWGSFGMRHKA